MMRGCKRREKEVLDGYRFWWRCGGDSDVAMISGNIDDKE